MQQNHSKKTEELLVCGDDDLGPVLQYKANVGDRSNRTIMEVSGKAHSQKTASNKVQLYYSQLHP